MFIVHGKNIELIFHNSVYKNTFRQKLAIVTAILLPVTWWCYIDVTVKINAYEKLTAILPLLTQKLPYLMSKTLQLYKIALAFGIYSGK